MQDCLFLTVNKIQNITTRVIGTKFDSSHLHKCGLSRVISPQNKMTRVESKSSKNATRVVPSLNCGSHGLFTEGFCSLFNASNEKFLNRGGLGEELKFVSPNGGLRKKKAKKFAFFAKITQI